MKNDIFYENLGRHIFGQAHSGGMEVLSTIIENVPERIPYLYGKSYLWTILNVIPRRYWPEKPGTIGLYLNREFTNSKAISGVPPSLIGEFYLNYSMLGVIIGCFLFGNISALILRKYYNNLENPKYQLLYTSYLVYFIPIMVRTEIRSAINNFAYIIITLLIGSIIIKPLKRY
jgi:oligosaccharide repeat unit polymerase